MMLPPRFFLSIFLLLNFIFITDSLAKQVNPFQGEWSNDNGTVLVTNCQGMRCDIKIYTMNGIHSCEVEEKLTVLSKNKAVFHVKNYHALPDAKRFLPVNLSLAHQIITITIPRSSEDATRDLCGMAGYFDGEYTNINTSRIYKTSFDCYKATTPIEHAICQSPELAEADAVLAKLYVQLKQRSNVVRQQKEWIKARDLLCTHSANLNKCLSDKYLNKILDFEQQIINSPTRSTSFSYDYLLYLAQQPNTESYDVFLDPPLQEYLKTHLPKNTTEGMMKTRFYGTDLKYANDSVIMITGGAPGLFTIYEGALVLTKDHQTWLAYIDIDDHSNSKIIVLSPQKAIATTIPTPLKQWIDHLLPYMKSQEVIYKQVFPRM